MFKYLLPLFICASGFAQGFSFGFDQPYFAGQSSVSSPGGGPIVLYDAFNAVKTTTGTNVDTDYVTAWTNTAVGGYHDMDLVKITNLNYAISETGNPRYSATGINGHPAVWLAGTNALGKASLFTDNYCTNFPQPFTIICVVKPTDVSGAAPPFNHAVWSANGDYDIGDFGMQDIGSPPWHGIFANDDAGHVLTAPVMAATPYIISCVYSNFFFARTNGIDFMAGTIGTRPFGATSKGFAYEGFDFGASTGTTPYYVGRWGLWPRLLSTNEIIAIECSWGTDFGISTPCAPFPSGLQFRWVGSDGLDANKVWVDRIQGAQWTNGNPATRPTSSGDHIVFDGSTTLTNNILTISSTVNYTWIWLVVQPQRFQLADGFFTIKDGLRGFDFSNFTGGNKVADPQTLSTIWDGLVNVTQDWLLKGNLNVSGGGDNLTNNISTGTSTTLVASSSDTFRELAATQAGGAPGKFLIYEMCVFTNNLSSADKITLHDYARRTYGVTP